MAGWVCLMYHDVLAGGAELTGGSAYFAVSVDGFRGQLDELARRGLAACSLEAWLAQPSERLVPLTFDDGTESQVNAAWPELARRGMSATIFVVTSWVGRPGYATWDQLRELRRGGMSIQSHTRTHPFLSELGAEELRAELSGAAADLTREIGEAPRTLALPGGDAPRRALRPLIAEAGYHVVATSHWGVNHGVVGTAVLEVRRCTVRGEIPLERFSNIVRGAPLLAARQRLREGLLGWTRTALGASRYARWRRALLDTLRPR